MPVWQNVNLKQKGVFEIIQREDVLSLPYYLSDEELDFFIRGIAYGPHAKTYLPRLLDRDKRPIYIARGYAPPSYSRLVKLRLHGPDPLLKDAGPNWVAGEEGEVIECVIGWRWLYAYWDGPLVDEVEGAAETKQWPAIADPDWTWEGLKMVRPPYYVPEDGRPWRATVVEEQAVCVPKGKGKGKGRGKEGIDSGLSDELGRS